MKNRFLRRKWYVFAKLGKGRRKKQVWRRPKGRHAKMREKRRGYGASPSVGFKSARADRGKIMGMMPVRINNMKDLLNIQKNEIAIMSAKIGSLKKTEMARKALELNVKFSNFDAKKFLEDFEKRKNERKQAKDIKKIDEKKKEVKVEKKEDKK